MRRRGGLVIAALLLTAGCTTGTDAGVQRSAGPELDAFSGAETVLERGTDATIDDITDLGVELAPGAVVEPEAVAAADSAGPAPASASGGGGGGSGGGQGDAALLDPVPARARAAVRPAAASPSGPAVTGHIEIPAIGVSHPTYTGVSLAVINHGPSHWPGTARPGHIGNTVFPGHRTTYSRPFHDLDRLAAGDAVIFTTNEGRFTYRVTRTFVVNEDDTWIVEPTSTPTFTIFACHPKGSARQRIVAVGELVSAPVPPPTTAAPPPTTRPPTTTTTTTPRGLLDVLFG